MDNWKPPTAAELKVIEARHERSNQISRLMGEYMLKGKHGFCVDLSLCPLQL